jgi:hypothetical protein
VIRRDFLSSLPLVAWIALFGSIALGSSVLGFDDHPGQLYRVWLVATNGIAPWAWHDGWWAGYPEMQFYPPGFAYAGAALSAISLGALGIDGAYHALVWVAWAAPGIAAYILLARTLGHGLLALPGACVVLTLSGGLASGVEGGVHIGMIAARLAWALLPVVLIVAATGRRTPIVIVLVAIIVVTHPAHAPAAVVIVLLAAVGEREGRVRRLGVAAAALACATALTAFWTVPLVARIGETRALAWGSIADLGGLLLSQPLVVFLVLLAASALVFCRRADDRMIARFAGSAVGLVGIVAVVFEPLGLRYLPADRLLDSAMLGVVLAAGVAIGRGIQAAVGPGRSGRATVATAVALVAIVALSLPGSTLTLWPHRAEWPTLESIDRGLRLPELWQQLRAAPEGRVLFVRSGLPLVYGTEWWRPHTHVTALTPRVTGRGIVHGTFTHPSPIAALIYRGDAERAPIRTLAERLDGRELFGRSLPELDAATFDRYADPLGVSAVVALDEDAPLFRVLDEHRGYRRVDAPAPFLLWFRTAPVAIPRRHGDGRWSVTVQGDAGRWTTARMAWYPLWTVLETGTRLPIRRGPTGDLQVLLPRASANLELVYTIGAAERVGLALTAIGLLAWVGWLAFVLRVGALSP